MEWVVIAIVVLLLVAVLGWPVLAYNRLVSMRERVRTAWSQIDVLLKRRHDLIPNLVETVRGYATHERDTLEAVIAARNGAVAAGDPQAKGQAEGRLSGAVRQLFAVAEAYPALKADGNFAQLQRELSDSENGIASRRTGYNNDVQAYNTAVQSFPNNFLAGPFGFRPEPLFEVQDPAQRQAPAVKF